jgi:putative CocE/NonD family hydrolase
MPTVHIFPNPVREIENLWIPMPDGARLAARLWLPEDAPDNPVPALFEFIPYRKSDGTAVRDALRSPYYAGHGYAVIRVDLRGSGESDGVITDEYTMQEHDDAITCIAWIAAQPWCNGKVGMMGISWGGFNSLQVAARQPPALKAILVIGFTDDRYADDVHYMGGCVLTSQMLSWSSVMFAYNPSPPDPRFVGERWREMWLERLEAGDPWVETWLSHQTRDAYWRHGSVGEDYDAIQVPVYAVGGWADSYNNSVPRLLAGLSVPRRGLIGPWAHTFPEMGEPGPAIGFLQDSLRWWDHWLKDIDTGIMDEPMLRTWIQDSVPPAVYYTERPGRWVADPAWPSPNVGEHLLYLNHDGAAGTLGETAAAARRVSYLPRLGHNLNVGQWGAYGYPGDYPGDQRTADGESLSFTSPPLVEPLDILGYPEVDLTLSVDRPWALVAVRLTDVAPDGASTLVSWGLLNLTHRDSHEQPAPLEPGRAYEVTVQLNVCGHRLVAGHSWRISLSPSFIRHAWPSPELVTLTLACGEASRVRLPVRRPQAHDATLPAFPPAESAPGLAIEWLRTGGTRKVIEQDLIPGRTTLRLTHDDGRMRYADTGMEVESVATETYSVVDGEPLSLINHISRDLEYQRAEWRVRVETESVMTADEAHFYLSHQLNAYEGYTRVFTKAWTKAIPRNFV